MNSLLIGRVLYFPISHSNEQRLHVLKLLYRVLHFLKRYSVLFLVCNMFSVVVVAGVSGAIIPLLIIGFIILLMVHIR